MWLSPGIDLGKGKKKKSPSCRATGLWLGNGAIAPCAGPCANPAGETRKVTLQHAGVVKLYCSIHESMNGTIFVAPTPWFATVKSDGTFAIPGVPLGNHRLRTWNEKLPDTERTIEVPTSGNLEVEIPLVP